MTHSRFAGIRNNLAAALCLAGAAGGSLSSSSSAVAGEPGGFNAGDLYLVSQSLPAGGGMANLTPGVMHIDPLTAAVTRLPFTHNMMQGRATYDPHRDRLIVMRLNAAPLAIDAAGASETLAIAWTPFPRLLAPTGCGRMYALGTTTIGVIGPDGSAANVLTEDGSQPLNFSATSAFVAMIYDATHNCLLIADPDGLGATRLRRITLSSDGRRAVGSIDTVTFDGVIASPDLPVGFNAAPQGQAFLKIDDNSNNTGARMLLVDPQTLAFAPFASSGYFGVAGETAGCYSSVRQQAVTLDTGADTLHAFDFGQSGAGTIIVSGVSTAGGSGETAQLVEIGAMVLNPIACPPPPTCTADIIDNNAVDVSDLLAVIAQWGPCANCPIVSCPADIAHAISDCQINISDLLAVINAWGPCP